MSTGQRIPIDAACSYPCEHPSCIQIRTLANTLCRLCGQTLGYEVWWTDSGNGDISRYQHEDCAPSRRPPHRGRDTARAGSSAGVGMNWDHSICDACWWKIFAGRSHPCRLDFEKREAEMCCFCGTATKSGIYVRHDPTLPALVCGPPRTPSEAAR